MIKRAVYTITLQVMYPRLAVRHGGGIEAEVDAKAATTIAAAWLDLVASWVAARPTAGNAAGLAGVREVLLSRIERMGFSVRRYANDAAAPILVAARPPEVGASWVGLFAHYDVEEAGEGWSSDPFSVRVVDGRAFGRGVADNLGPLALRLLALEDLLGRGSAREALPGLVWIIQGEEEIGSPWAHTLFPRLELPTVQLWLEETGYFEEDGTQRVLARRISSLLVPALDRLRALAAGEGRGLHVLDRYLNKAFAESRCPCLTHLVREAPYLSIGPNDTRSRIHAPDESLPLGTLELSAAQLLGVLHEVARCG